MQTGVPSEEVRAQLLAYVTSLVGAEPGPDENYFAQGLVSSLVALELVTLVEHRFGVTVEVGVSAARAAARHHPTPPMPDTEQTADHQCTKPEYDSRRQQETGEHQRDREPDHDGGRPPTLSRRFHSPFVERRNQLRRVSAQRALHLPQNDAVVSAEHRGLRSSAYANDRHAPSGISAAPQHKVATSAQFPLRTVKAGSSSPSSC
jgi:hypothetical protein